MKLEAEEKGGGGLKAASLWVRGGCDTFLAAENTPTELLILRSRLFFLFKVNTILIF